MSQNSLDQIFKSKLANQETDLSDRVSFEAVMEKRSTKTKSGIMKPVLWGIAGLSLITATALFWSSYSSASPKAADLTQNNPGSNATEQMAGNSALSASDKNTSNNSLLSVSHSVNNSQSPKFSNTYKKNTGTDLPTTTQSEDVVANPVKNPVTNSTSVVPGNNGSTTPVLISNNAHNNRSEEILSLSQHSESFALNSRALNLRNYLGEQMFNFDLAPANQQLKAGELNISPQRSGDNGKHNLAFELMISAGRYENGLINFNGGTVTQSLHNAGYYQGKVLFNLPSDSRFQLGGGLGFGQNSGSGTMTRQQTSTARYIDSHVIVIIQPGMPNTYKTVYDTSFKQETQTQQGRINYTQSRINVPMTFNYLLGSGMVSFRLSGTVAPGLLIYQKGTLFSEGNVPAETKTQYKASFDARLGLGLMVNLNNRTQFIVEPGVQYFSESGQARYSRLLPGVGIGLSFKY